MWLYVRTPVVGLFKKQSLVYFIFFYWSLQVYGGPPRVNEISIVVLSNVMSLFALAIIYLLGFNLNGL